MVIVFHVEISSTTASNVSPKMYARNVTIMLPTLTAMENAHNAEQKIIGKLAPLVNANAMTL